MWLLACIIQSCWESWDREQFTVLIPTLDRIVDLRLNYRFEYNKGDQYYSWILWITETSYSTNSIDHY